MLDLLVEFDASVTHSIPPFNLRPGENDVLLYLYYDRAAVLFQPPRPLLDQATASRASTKPVFLLLMRAICWLRCDFDSCPLRQHGYDRHRRSRAGRHVFRRLACRLSRA
jgi:hypothetical protein